MRDKSKSYTGVCALILVMALALGQSLLLGGCGGCQKEQPPAPTAKAQQPVPPPAPVKAQEPAPPAGPPLGPVVPVTLNVLKLTPESAMVTLALPPVPALLDKGIALAKRVAPPGVDIDAQVAEAISEMAQDADVPDAKSLADIAKAKGFNADAPVALYIDFSPSAQSCKEALEVFKAEAQKSASTTPPPEPASKTEAAPKEGETPKTEGSAAPAPPVEAKAPDMDKILASCKAPAIAAVIGCANPGEAATSINAILDSTPGYVDKGKVETVDVDGVAVKCYDPEKLAYAIAGDKLVVGNSLALVKQVLGRVNAPAMVRYGTVECPASSPDEVVMLTRMDKVAPLVKDLLPAIVASQPAMAQMPPGQLDYLNKMLDSVAGDDPLVTTLEWTDKKVEFLTRCDLKKHPGLAEQAGEAQPLRLAQMLPETTQTMLSFRINSKTKEQFKTGWMDSLPPDVKSQAGVAQALTVAGTVLDLLSDEITIGIAGSAGGLPQIYLLAGLANVDQAKNLLQTYNIPMTPSEPYNGVEISSLAVPSPLPFYVAFVENTFVLCNDQDKLKGIIDMAKAKTTSKFFSSLDPALDAATPRFITLLVKSGLISDIVKPMSAFFGGIPAEVQGPLDKVTSAVRELLLTRDLKNNWLEDRLSIYLN